MTYPWKRHIPIDESGTACRPQPDCTCLETLQHGGMIELIAQPHVCIGLDALSEGV